MPNRLLTYEFDHPRLKQIKVISTPHLVTEVLELFPDLNEAVIEHKRVTTVKKYTFLLFRLFDKVLFYTETDGQIILFILPLTLTENEVNSIVGMDIAAPYNGVVNHIKEYPEDGSLLLTQLKSDVQQN